jgi:hypothetical protein
MTNHMPIGGWKNGLKAGAAFEVTEILYHCE